MGNVQSDKESLIEKLLEPLDGSREDHCTPESPIDEETQRLFREQMACKTAVRREFGKNPDVEDAWRKFKEEHSEFSITPTSSRHKLTLSLGWLFGAAAVIACLFFFGWYRQGNTSSEQVFQAFIADTARQEVTLQIADGKLLSLSPATDPKQLQQAGAVFQQYSDSLGLVYGSSVLTDIPRQHTLTTPRGQDFQVKLSDGTIVWLNAESRLEYPSCFTGKERRVRLQGEAYFQVARNEEMPFVVEASGVTTKVLGTEFNFRSYSSADTHVTLICGSVEVKGNQHSGYTKIKPGEDARLKSDGSFELKQVDTDIYTYWKEGFFYFDNVSLENIVQELGRWYNIDIVFRHREALNYRMHFLCDRHGSMEEVVELLNLMKKANVELKDRVLYID